MIDLKTDDARTRILAAAARLMVSEGPDAATTRAVALAAGVQAPTIYRLFGDKGGLLEAAAEHIFSEYVAGKAARDPTDDPIDDLRHGWDTHVAFGLGHPSLFSLIHASASKTPSAAAAAGIAVLRQRVRRIAEMGMLAVTEERAVDLVRVGGTGTVFTLLETPSDDHGGLSAAAREAVLAAILVPGGERRVRGAAAMASGLRAQIDALTVLTPAERALLGQWLEKVIDPTILPTAPAASDG